MEITSGSGFYGLVHPIPQALDIFRSMQDVIFDQLLGRIIRVGQFQSRLN